MTRVVVVGGGVAGLTVAHRLVERDPSIDVAVLEATDRPGGKLADVEVGGVRVPAGADAFVARKPWAVDLCRDLGLELVAPASSGAWLWTAAGLVPYPADTAFGIPGDPGSVFRWPGLSGRGRRRALRDLLIRSRRDPAEETLGALLRRRLGDEATDRAIAPLLGGLYAGDVDRLSAPATFPELVAWERAQGSLIRGAQAAMRTARDVGPAPLFLRPARGVHALPEALASGLGDRVRTGTRATAVVAAREGGWRVEADGPHGGGAGDAVVLAVPAAQARRLLDPVARAAAEELAGLRAVSTGVVALVYPSGTADGLPDGTGFVVPRGAAPFTAVTWLSSKWPDPAYGSRAVLRCFVGADGDEDVLDAPDEDIVAACAQHLSAVLPVPDPAAWRVVRWPDSMPQYEIGHRDRIERIRRDLPPGVVVTGQPYDGVGVPDVVRAAGEAAAAVLDHLRSRP
ncbi:MAG TPA: protoporphyrinogen oxidase [Actinomycetota bacterium]|nr:protoporphyrinogen oxidase [Actinomycetota bacterium]